ncbi:MAG: hypothetical protein II877_03965 [Synergistaceae bacterium]|nr:hypothetical protein [Synergistaceae bacterium]
MLYIDGKTIYLTRGDSANVTVGIKDSSGNDYEPVAGDKIYFRLKKGVFGKGLVFMKEIDPATRTLVLMPSDTAKLDFTSYRYEIELVTAGGDRYTVIEDGEFVVGVELEEH